MPAKGYKKANAIPRAEGDELRIRKLWMRDSDFDYVQQKYGTFAEGVRALITADRRATEDAEFGKRRTSR